MLFEESLDVATQHWRIIRTATGVVISEGDLPLILNSATYSPDGRLIAGTGAGGEVLTIDARSGDGQDARRRPDTAAKA